MTTALWLLLWLLTPQGGASNSISGTVVRALTDQPLANEEVGLWPTARTVRTDPAGKFLFRNVEPGEYALVVMHDRMRARVPILLTASSRAENVTIEVKPAPAITGTVFDPFGERAAGVRVQAYRRIYHPSGPTLRSVMSVMTDDLGEYRLFRLQPGEYYVSASLSERDQRLGASGIRLTPNLSKPDEGFPALFFGDAYNANQAQRINLGQTDNSGTNIYLKGGPRYSVSGRLIGESQNGDACGQVAVVPEGGLLDPERDFSANICGAFRITGLSPGSYYAVAMGVGIASDAISFTILTRDIERLSVLMRKTVTISGRVSSDGPLPTAGLRVQLVRAMSGLDQRLEGITERDGSFAIQNVGPGAFDTFIDPLPQEAYLRSVRFQQQDGLRAPMLFDAASGVPAAVAPADGGRGGRGGAAGRGFGGPLGALLPRLDIQLAARGAAAEGTAVDGAGKPVPGAEVVLIPVTYRNREDRYLRTFADPAGNFRVNGIPPGSYSFFAFEEIEPGAYFALSYDASLSQRYASRGQRVEITEVDRQQLKVSVISAFETAGGLR